MGDPYCLRSDRRPLMVKYLEVLFTGRRTTREGEEIRYRNLGVILNSVEVGIAARGS